MKSINRLIIISFILVTSNIVTYSQGKRPYLDSLRIRIEDKMELSLATYDYTKLGDSVENDLKVFQNILKQNINDIPKEKAYSITYEPGKVLSIKESIPVKKIILKNNEQIRCFFSDQCKIIGENYTLLIRFNNIEDLFSEKMITKISEAQKSLPEESRWASTYNFSSRGSVLTHDKQFDKVNGQMDVLNLKFGMGAGLIKNQPITDISAEVGFLFSKKGILKNQLYLSANLFYLYGFNSYSNVSFYDLINVGYRYNLSNELGKTNWLGVEFGYMLGTYGAFFPGNNTFDLGLNWEIGKSISVSTRIYLSNGHGYSEIFPGIRIGFGF